MLFLRISRDIASPLSRQIHDGIRSRILAGKLEGGTKLPSSRALATELGVSRNVALAAFASLEAEGLVASTAGSGTYVVEGLTLPSLARQQRVAPRPVGMSGFRTDVVDFRTGLPDLKKFSIASWSRSVRVALEAITPRDLAYAAPEGRQELRQALVRYVHSQRGVDCREEQLVITSGTTQAIGLVGRLVQGLFDNAFAVVEDPVTRDIVTILRNCGLTIVPGDLDSRGLNPSSLPNVLTGRGGLLYLTPSHHYPLGVVLCAKRRVELIEYARQHNAWLVEDDYDSEFRFDGEPLASLQSYAPVRTIYIGTFSKTLFPSLRIGYLILPEELVDAARQAKWATDLHNPMLEQLALAHFLRTGAYGRHLRSMRRLYGARRKHLGLLLERAFGDAVEVLGAPVGLHLCARFRDVDFNLERLARLEAARVKVYPVEEHALRRGRYRDAVVLGYGRLGFDELERGVELLRAHL